jgi:predicted nucleic acid-binding protein
VRVLADTPVWSAALRRLGDLSNPYRDELVKLLDQGVVEIIGPIRQEVLSGVKEPSKFNLLKERLRAFPDLQIGTNDYEEAASLYNLWRSKGVQGSFTDFLICTVAIRDNLEIFTDDKDFEAYQKILPIRLHLMTRGTQ